MLLFRTRFLCFHKARKKSRNTYIYYTNYNYNYGEFNTHQLYKYYDVINCEEMTSSSKRRKNRKHREHDKTKK